MDVLRLFQQLWPYLMRYKLKLLIGIVFILIGNLIAIIWSDGYYYANLIHKRTNNQIANITDIDYVSNGLYQVFGTVPLGLLGCI